MPKVTRRVLLSLCLLPALALFAACGGDDDDSDAEATRSASEATTAVSEESPTTEATAEPTDESAPSGSNAASEKLNAVDVPYDMSNGYELGSADAKVVLTVYEDFQCPHCLNYTVNTEPMLINEYVKTGKIRIEFQNLPILGQESVLAAFAGHCAAEQGLFWEYHKELFLVQAEAGQLTDEKLGVGRFSPENLAIYAQDVGIEEEPFLACLASEDTVAALTQQVADAQALGFRGTPSFAINGVAQSGQPSSLGGWRNLLDGAIEEAE